jgi:hypothetical protein
VDGTILDVRRIDGGSKAELKVVDDPSTSPGMVETPGLFEGDCAEGGGDG